MKPTIVVVVEGGCVTSVVCDSPLDVDVVIRDFDNIEVGEEDPIENIDDYKFALW